MERRDEVATAWRLLQINWIPLALMSAALALAVACTRFSIEPVGLAVSLGFVAVYAGFGYANARSPVRRDPQVMFVLGSTAQIVLVTVVMSPLTYVAAAANFPLQDANLLAIDRALGLDWAGYVAFVNDRPLLASWLSYGYTMIRWPIFAIPVVLAAVHRYRRIQEFTLALALALIATTIVSALVPAIGVYQQIGLDPAELKSLDPRAYLDQVRDLAPVRDGTLRHLDLFGLAGIVTFPSFHAASAVLYAGRSGRCGGCGRSRSSPTARCWHRRRSTAGTTSSTWWPASRWPCSPSWRRVGSASGSRRKEPRGQSRCRAPPPRRRRSSRAGGHATALRCCYCVRVNNSPSLPLCWRF